MGRVFVVTGSNKGIGKEIVKQLLQDKEEKIVYLTSRNPDAGQNAVQDFEKLGLKPYYHQLDIMNEESIKKLRDYLKEKHGGLDVLVNNAGMSFTGSSTAPFEEQAQVTSDCNFIGTLNTSNILLPVIKENGRIVNVSSFVSEMAYQALSDEMKAKFADPNLTMEGLRTLINDFIQAAKDGNVKEKGFPENAYAMSKVAVSFMSQIQQKEIDRAYPNKNILLNFCDPGYVSTDMTAGTGPLTVEEGADTPTYLALLPISATSPKGEFHKLRKVVPYPPA